MAVTPYPSTQDWPFQASGHALTDRCQVLPLFEALGADGLLVVVPLEPLLDVVYPLPLLVATRVPLLLVADAWDALSAAKRSASL